MAFGFLPLLAALGAVQAPAVATPARPAVDQHPIRAAYSQIPLSFEPNQGQSAGPVKFLSRGPGYSVFLTPSEAVLALSRPKPAASRSPGQGKTQSAVVRMKLLGGNPQPEVRGLDELSSRERRDFLADVHWADPGRALMLAKALGVLPARVLILGCQPETLDDFSLVLSPAVESALPRAAEVIDTALARLTA